MRFLAIDPGCTHSGFVVFCDEEGVIRRGKQDNNQLIKLLPQIARDMRLTVLLERTDYTTNRTGLEVIDTAIWIGRFMQAMPGTFTIGRKRMLNGFGIKGKGCDKQVRQLVLDHYPKIRLANDEWQAFLTIIAYKNEIY